jgi:hypothetical protein
MIVILAQRYPKISIMVVPVISSLLFGAEATRVLQELHVTRISSPIQKWHVHREIYGN